MKKFNLNMSENNFPYSFLNYLAKAIKPGVSLAIIVGLFAAMTTNTANAYRLVCIKLITGAVFVAGTHVTAPGFSRYGDDKGFGKESCLDISSLPPGTQFQVNLHVNHLFWQEDYSCTPGTRTQTSDQTTINYHAWGYQFTPHCEAQN
ncbi:MAG: hypothetical protein ACRC5A_02930 [Enterobacteriaceae bacterium]